MSHDRLRAALLVIWTSCRMLPWQAKSTRYHQYWTDNNQHSQQSKDTMKLQDSMQSGRGRITTQCRRAMLLPLIRDSLMITTSFSTISLQRHIFSHHTLTLTQEQGLGLALRQIEGFQSLCLNSTRASGLLRLIIGNRMSQARGVMTHHVRMLFGSLSRIITP